MASGVATQLNIVQQRRQAKQTWWLGYGLIVGGGLVVTAIARRRFTEPFLGVSLAVILAIALGWVIRPKATLYTTIFLTAVSDQVTASWFPFVKNLSSRESISFLADGATISPLEISLYLGFLISVLRRYARNRTLIASTALTRPLLAFTFFVIMGFVRGILAGGNLRIAILEGRAMLYILLVFAIMVNECTEDRQFRSALYAILAGVIVQSMLSIVYLQRLESSERDLLESLNEHGSAIGQNLILVTLLALLLLDRRSPLLKWSLAICLLPVMYVYFYAQRRAGVAALIVAGVMIAIALFWRRRRAFWVVTPIVTFLLIGYLGAFWNSTSAVAFPAGAMKSIIAPGSASAEDQSSDLYRIVESYDLNFTIRTSPLLGFGFGHAFLRPVPLPDISFFELNAYLPHNSVLWVWIKTGFGGFVTMFYVFGKTVMLGARRIRTLPHGIDLATTLAATMFVVMFAVYTYVDVSWDARNTVFLGVAAAVCARGAPMRRSRTVASAPDQEPTTSNESITPAMRSA